MPSRHALEFEVLRAGAARPRHLHAFVTSLVEADVDPVLHHANVKAFSIVPPIQTARGFAVLVSTLHPAAEAALHREVSRRRSQSRQVRFGDLHARFAREPVVEAGRASFELLHERAVDQRLIELEFRSPTVFRSGKDVQVPFPLPSQVFGHYRSRWNAFAPDSLHCSLAFDELGLRVAGFEGRGEPFVDGHRRGDRVIDVPFLGFVGKVAFEAAGVGADGNARRWLHALASFGEFCGTGANTTIGMGATRYLQSGG